MVILNLLKGIFLLLEMLLELIFLAKQAYLLIELLILILQEVEIGFSRRYGDLNSSNDFLATNSNVFLNWFGSTFSSPRYTAPTITFPALRCAFLNDNWKNYNSYYATCSFPAATINPNVSVTSNKDSIQYSLAQSTHVLQCTQYPYGCQGQSHILNLNAPKASVLGTVCLIRRELSNELSINLGFTK